jgi:DNA-binding NtrC family response regulator
MDDLRILLVDDEIDTLESLKDVFEDKNYKVDTLDSGTKVVDYLKQHIFDVILMDIKMPSLNGVETYQRIKETCKAGKTTVILMTAYSLDDLIKEAIHDGVYAILRKPINIDNLFKTIRQAKEGALILIVEDAGGSSEGLKDILVDEGFLVKVVPSGEAAIEWAEKHTHDIVLLAERLPLMNGLETHHKIGKINPNAVTIVMTTQKKDMTDAAQWTLQKSAYATMQKPLDIERLLYVIEEISTKRQHGIPI